MFGRKKEKKKVIRFHYKDRVEIIAGFYRGSIGVLIDRERERVGPQYYVLTEYQIKLDDGAVVWASEREIRETT